MTMLTFVLKGCGKGVVYILLSIINPLSESLKSMHILEFLISLNY
jgi:hypothetical protein